MAELPWLPETLRNKVLSASNAASEALREDLCAVCLIGASAGPNRNFRGNSVELLIVARELPEATLDVLGAELGPLLRDGLQIRMVTQLELEGSTDVLALELAEWRARNVVLAGEDPFSELTIAPDDLRHELERALRTLAHRLRNRLLWCLATHQRHLDPMLRDALERLTMVGYHTLELLGQPLPLGEGQALARFADWAGVSAEGLDALRERLTHNGQATDPIAELRALASVTNAACARIDTLNDD
ncbi:hypothetical protein PPSIR1_05653 [Plesiocystis pacifica SIR-1]|uniref:Uncharacterized protein n=1 Tax=Plesiocystis pacifica SIR-1 TaxID=391625 RepID=A6FXA3_9BACT|nr:hypothetical protein [Plesiocystis pacifica]EDM81927.1 hypothetical protein PPSIR1_05653 [Plesiocystis pacifica SIR-1]